MTYTGTIENTVIRDELLAGAEEKTMLYNINVDSTAAITRGTILAGKDFNSVFAPVSSSADADKTLVIAADNFTADSDNTVTSAFVSGRFHREKLILDDSLDIADFEPNLRKQNILLTSLKEVY